MSRLVLLLRPEPGASESAARAGVLGLEPVRVPLFTVRPLPWDAPDPADFDAILVTSANALRHGGPALAAFVQLPTYAVGDATATAARAAGFRNVAAGDADGEETLRLAAVDGRRRVLHLCGRDHVALSSAGVTVERRLVYAARAVERLPEAAVDALRRGALVLLHSPRAAALFASLVADRAAVRLAAISPAAAAAAGGGWGEVHEAPRPSDKALLELAARLCQTGRPQQTKAGG